MVKIIFVLCLIVFVFSATAFSNTGSSEPKKVAAADVNVQRDNPDVPTRIITEGTKIKLHFGDTVIPGILNDSIAARSLLSMLPYTMHMNRYSYDFCGVMDDALEYKEENVRYDWLNGDIAFSRDANYFTVIFADEESSERYGHLVNLGVISCELSRISNLQGSYDVLIELAD